MSLTQLQPKSKNNISKTVIFDKPNLKEESESEVEKQITARKSKH